MTSYVYLSAFSTGSAPGPGVKVPTGNPSVAFESSGHVGQPATSQGLASFICHVAYLDDKLQRGDQSVFFATHQASVVNRKRIGNGASFIVERAELQEPQVRSEVAESSQTRSAQKTARIVVVKTVRENCQNRNQWTEVLLEIRALLHEPIRYHPNIVRLLGIRWDASVDTGSPFPAIVQEYASFGTLDKLQQRSKPLPFSVKQKLCYDVGRGLSIIHACGMVHGDLKHENVLIFPNTYPQPPNQPYTAKLADFGGTVMDMGMGGTHQIPMHTFPYEAPEISDKLTEEGAKKTDAYSYGMLIWRCMTDSQDLFPAMGVAGSGRAAVADAKLREKVQLAKLSDGILEAAILNVANYCFAHRIPAASFNIITSALMFTLRGNPNQRALDRAQVRLRGMDAVDAYGYVHTKDVANTKISDNIKYRTPGMLGINMDSLGFALGRLGNDYDAQNNLPGFRSDLPRPERDGFLFEPLKLRQFLDRPQQEAIVRDLERFANPDTGGGGAEELKPKALEAAFFLFQSYICGFGVAYDPEKACYWLRRAASVNGEEMGTTDYLALAWLNRIHAALGVANPYSAETQIQNLFLSVLRGHRHCAEDGEAVIKSTANAAQRQAWKEKLNEADQAFRVLTGSTGMPFFAIRKLTRRWDLNDLDILDAQLRQELGREYESCLRPPPDSDGELDPPPDDGYRFDKIYVNHTGHGLLHLAAVRGNLTALKHLYKKYLCDINLKNQSHGDTVLTCACRTGRFSVVMWCLDNGADPNSGKLCEESPLHCISTFNEPQMETVVAKLLAAGADIEKHSAASRKDNRGILADWEDNFSMTLTPLGRAVLKQSLPAVRVLLKHGASPTDKRAHRNVAYQSPVELAAILTLPDILEELLRHVSDTKPVFDECDMLDAAHSGQITPYDSLSLHNRLVRCGTAYKRNLQRTLEILHERSGRQPPENKREHPPGKHLCAEILLGNNDIVSALLSLGHDPLGSPQFRPLSTAVKVNHADIFHLLVSRNRLPSLFPDVNEPSLLHALAERPPHVPRDLTIAEYLISHGTPIDPVTPNHPSPLVLAIINGFYELADLLVAHGAGESLNTLYTSLPTLPGSCPPPTFGDHGTEPSSTTLLGILLRSQTSSALRALTYLAHLHKNEPSITLSPLAYCITITTTTADGKQQETAAPPAAEVVNVPISAVHALSTVPPSEWNSHNQISASIVQHLLDLFPSEVNLGQELALNRVLGSAVTAAVARGHPEVLRALLVAPGYHDTSSHHYHHPHGDGKENEVEITALEMAKTVAIAGLTALEGREEVREAEVEDVKRAGEIVEMFEELGLGSEKGSDQPGDSLEGFTGETNASAIAKKEEQGRREMWRSEDFAARIAVMEARMKPDFVEPEIDRVSKEVNFPVDLSVLTDERPSGWKEGAEMESEMALRSFLKSFRRGDFGDSIVKGMSKAFNKRDDKGGVSGEEGKTQ
ncbi:Serine/threonine-protein kinase HT1 [Corynascus novoguineensis]|uniref:Serine/threonine-protein kinase HT1 n=1 Tax=Corynascus novoguineensis TaxID=1126955 RepID=A0AAN7HGM1_9PEZI|nr:Serine/threonine-protein kinase HT1 [Corynascus novoguineensis]